MATKNKKKKSNKAKKSYLKYLTIIVIMVLLAALVYVFLNAKDDTTNLTLVEKKWIANHKDTLMDMNVPNGLSVLADDGKGIVFDYIKKVEKDTDLSFNKKSYNYGESNNLSGLSVLIVKPGEKIKSRDSLITEDNYVLVGKKDEKVISLRDILNLKLGVMNKDLNMLKNELGKNYTFNSYSSLDGLMADVSKGKVDYAIVPRYYGLEKLVANKLYINYTFDNISNKVVLRTGDNTSLNTIMEKYLTSFKKNDYDSSYKKSFMSFYETNSGATDLEITSLSNKVYNYGYVKGSNYNIKQNGELGGYAGEYITMLKDMAKMDIEYKEYSSDEALTEAIESGDVNIAFIDFEYDNNNGLYTSNGFNTSLVALSKTNYQITSKEGLQNRDLYTIKGSPINLYLKSNLKANINEIGSIKKSIPDDSILVLDEIDYYYYASKNQTDGYYTLVKDAYNSGYNFFVQNNEKVLYDYINFCLDYSDSNNIKQVSINKLVDTGLNRSNFFSVYLIIVLSILVPIIVLFILIALIKNKSHTKLLRKESVLKYTDMLTSLKNRNYLRDNAEKWDEVKISPRAIVVIDLNNLSYVNDNYGLDEGNELIKKAAAILINTQLEKSEIMRTDGNEFLLYLVGYTNTQVKTYIGKLSKEFEKLPYNFGAAIGYSMIEDEIKTIDDAINEANIEMRKDKEQNYK